MSRKRVIQAIKILQEEIPAYVNGTIMGDCPCDLGLPASMRKWCGMDDTTAELTPDYCEKCWAEALKNE